jgi:hypothetical protein
VKRVETHTERTLLDLLHERHGRVHGNGRRYVVAEHVRSGAGWADATADCLVMDLWQSSRNAVHGFEVKTSRADWLRELRTPEKAEVFRRFAHYWWLVAGDRGIVRDDLPDGWGLLVASGRGLRAVVQAPRRDPEPMAPGMVAAFLRAAVVTSERRAEAAVDTRLVSARVLQESADRLPWLSPWQRGALRDRAVRVGAGLIPT